MIVIEKFAPKNTPDYSHLQPVVDYLLKKGNSASTSFLWGVNRTGYFCHLSKTIDFNDLLEHFKFPETIRLDSNEQRISCLNSYTVIRGAMNNG